MEHMQGDSIVCLACKMRSYNPNDINNKYCSNCHTFHTSTEEYRIHRRLRLWIMKFPAQETQS